jgi:hypothetical protein
MIFRGVCTAYNSNHFTLLINAWSSAVATVGGANHHNFFMWFEAVAGVSASFLSTGKLLANVPRALST